MMTPYLRRLGGLPLTLALLFSFQSVALALDMVSVKRGEEVVPVEGEILVEAVDGGLLLQAPDGTLWMIQPDEIQSRSRDDRPFTPLTAEQMIDRLQAEMPAGFQVHKTAHYVICYNTSKTYAEWCGSLYEQLYRGFYNYWKTRGWRLEDPRFPLVALVFDSRQSFAAYSRPELGDSVDSLIGYYNMRTNRVNMYDLTGADDLKRFAPRISSTAHINQILSQPAAERTVATIVHEATHQLAYNSGMQVRFAENPLWVSEGLAMFFEAPDYKSDRGWKTVGAVNQVHLNGFRRYLLSRPGNSLMSLVADDSRFRDPQHTSQAYSESWALNYFLLNRRRDQYIAYLQRLSERHPLIPDTVESRLALFREIFGDPQELDQDFVKFMRPGR